MLASAVRRVARSLLSKLGTPTLVHLITVFYHGKLCSFSFSLIRKGCSQIRSGASNSFGALLKNASAIWSLHWSAIVCFIWTSVPIPYYMNVIPTNLKVRFVSKIRPQKWTNVNAHRINCWLNKLAPKNGNWLAIRSCIDELMCRCAKIVVYMKNAKKVTLNSAWKMFGIQLLARCRSSTKSCKKGEKPVSL